MTELTNLSEMLPRKLQQGGAEQKNLATKFIKVAYARPGRKKLTTFFLELEAIATFLQGLSL